MQPDAGPMVLAHKFYWEPAHFQSEMQTIETAVWVMAGLLSDLSGDNDYLTLIVGEKSVVIQNFKGELRAFDNVCAHRLSRIRLEEKGNGPLRCPYHSWVYNAEGRPVAIPHEQEAFGFDEAERRDVHLKRWQMALCGQFIFIRGSDRGPSLSETLGETFAPLSEISNSLGREIDTFKCEYNANWKICVENTLDEYHAQFVHPTTFRPMLSGDFTYSYDGHQSKVEAGITEKNIERWQRIAKHFESRAIKTDTYYHYLVFPLMTVASTFGINFSIQTFRPLSPERTLLTSRLFLGTQGAPSNRSIEESLGSSAREFNRTVFLEDKFVCEQVQLGLKQRDAPRGVIGKYEQRLAHFQKCAQEIFGYK